jgi:RimJ/RimL family protein N-acetyltransferase
MLKMPTLKAPRIHIRDFAMDDLEAVHRILLETFPDASKVTRPERSVWMKWTILGYEQLALLAQPPYGDRAIVFNHSQELIGVCGLVPSLMPFGQLPSFADPRVAPNRGYTPEVGLFWAIAPAHQRKGYASEAARALIDYAFDSMRLKRIVATTEYRNTASMGVMQKVGMRLKRNPHAEPPWMQVVGVLDNL